MNDIPVVDIACLVAFLGLAALSAIFLKRLRFPYTIGLVLIGIVVGSLAGHFKVLEPVTFFKITPNVILYILLPALVFDAAVNIEIRLLIHNLLPTLILAGPGLVVAMLITAGLVSFGTPLSLGSALVFGALISATDPVAVIALFRELGAPRRLAMLVDGESLFNDATAMVAFQILCGLVAGGTMTFLTVGFAGVQFVAVFAGGALVGALIGWLMVRMLALIDNDPLVTIAFSTVVAYASFLIANYYLEVSGVMAVVGAGLVVSWHGSTRFTPEVREYMRHFWGYAAFVANSFVFLLLGLTEFSLLQGLGEYIGLLPFIMVAVAAIIVARLVVVFGITPLINRLPRVVPVDWRTQTAMCWGGLRGALPIGLAISLSQDFPDRQLIIVLTLGVVLFTLLVQGTTIGGVIRLLGLNRRTPAEEQVNLNALAAAHRAALKSLARELPGDDGEIRRDVEQKYRQELAAVESRISAMRERYALAPDIGKLHMFRLQLNNVELQATRALMEEGVIGAGALRRIEREAERRSEDINLELPLVTAEPKRTLGQRLNYIALMRLSGLTGGRFTDTILLRLLSKEYQYNCGLVIAGEKLREQLPHLAELSLIDEKDVAEAREFYDRRAESARQGLQALSYRHPEMTFILMGEMFNGTARAAARSAIAQIAQTGGISESVVGELAADMPG